MKLIETKLKGLFYIEPFYHEDERGTFVKTFNKDFFIKNDIDFRIEESYYSVSDKNVIRGMHFQVPPHDHSKIIYVNQGSLTDVVLDIRNDSETYGKYVSTLLSAENRKMLYIPSGFAHGFISHEKNTLITYLQTTQHHSDSDKGIKYDSFGYCWGTDEPVISDRDSLFPLFDKFKSPF